MFALPDLGDERVRLRPFEERDVPAVTRACQDPAIQRYTRLPTPYGEEDARAFVSGAVLRRVAGDSLDLAIAHAGDARLLGAIGIIGDRHDAVRGEVGYWVAPEARGVGVAGRALMLLSRWALGPGGLERLDLQAAVDNGASIRVAERCGFVREGTLRAAWYRGPARSDVAFFSLLRADLGGPGA